MLIVKKEGIIIAPSELEFENLSTFNPGVYQDGQYVHIFYRALDKNHISTIGYAKLKGPTEIVERWKKPFMTPRYKYEKCGIEDPRIVKIDKTFYMTYVVHDGVNALTAYSYGEDLFKLKRGGIISSQMTYDKVGTYFQYSALEDKYYFFKSFYKDTVNSKVKLWDKDMFLFPEKIDGKFVLLHRVLPDIQMVAFSNFTQLKENKFWKEYFKKLSDHVVLESEHGFESRNVGGGAPPIKTRHGWLMIYHGVEPMNKGRIYHAGAALLDLKNPTKIIARLPHPLFSPDQDFEMTGHVSNVVFPTGTAIFKDRIYIYYGTADSSTAVASINLNSLIHEILKYRQA